MFIQTLQGPKKLRKPKKLRPNVTMLPSPGSYYFKIYFIVVSFQDMKLQELFAKHKAVQR